MLPSNVIRLWLAHVLLVDVCERATRMRITPWKQKRLLPPHFLQPSPQCKAVDKCKILGVLFGVVGGGGKRTKEHCHDLQDIFGVLHTFWDIFGGAIQKLLLLTSGKILAPPSTPLSTALQCQPHPVILWLPISWICHDIFGGMPSFLIQSYCIGARLLHLVSRNLSLIVVLNHPVLYFFPGVQRSCKSTIREDNWV